MSAALSEFDVEDFGLGVLRSSAGRFARGQEIAPGGAHAEREGYGQVVLATRLHDALARLNPGLSAEVLEEALRSSPDLRAQSWCTATGRPTVC